MDILSETTMPAVAMASALAVGAGAYLNAKLAISTDLTTLSHDRAFGKRLAERIGNLGESTTIYKLLERVVEVEGHGADDALWFEHKTWSYNQIKDGRIANFPYVETSETNRSILQRLIDSLPCFTLEMSRLVILWASSPPIPPKW